MKRWAPLLDIFLNSPCPESEASRWLNQSYDTSSSSSSITTNSFIYLLSKPTDAVVVDSSSPSHQFKKIMWMQTLPDAVQSRILSFLSVNYQKFCTLDLSELAKKILSEGEGLNFWVKKSADQLLERVSQANYKWVSGFNLDSEEESLENEFESLPNWLKDEASANSPLLPWLPLAREELISKMPINSVGDYDTSMVEVEEVEKESVNQDLMEIEIIDGALDQEIEEKATHLKTRILNIESTAETVGLAKEIRQLCLERGADSLKILSLMEPWKADDEIASTLISSLLDRNDKELGWSSHVLSSFILPKLLVLEESASRVLMAAVIECCKVNQRATTYALLHPLILRKEGITKAICEVFTRITKECFHPAHVSAFCQKLLCGEEGEKRKFMCLPCHHCLISRELVWNESLFSLFQNILNQNVYFTQDTVDQLVNRVSESVGGFSKSLKFGNFLLCLVNKCASLLKSHKRLMIEVVEHTDTLVTKSVLNKLNTL